MAIKNNLLGGTDFAEPTTRIKPTDLNDTNNAIINTSIKGTAQVPFSTLKAAGAWTNEGSLAADRFTVAAGVNGTINTGDSTALFDTNKYKNNLFLNDVNWVNPSGTNTTVGSSSTVNNPDNFFDGDVDTNASFSFTGSFATERNWYCGRTFSSKIVYRAKITFSRTWTSADWVGSNATTTHIEVYDGSSWSSLGSVTTGLNFDSLTHNLTVNIGYAIQGIRCRSQMSRSSSSSTTVDGQFKVLFENLTPSLISTVTVDTSTLTLNGTEKTIALYNSATIPVNTSIKCQLSDETKTISTIQTLTANGTTLIPITTTPTADDVLKMTFTLETSNTTITPEFMGYGVYKN